MTRGELADLLEGARARNTRHGITGMLVYDAGYFIQMLEGPEAAVRQLLKNIRNDPRHDEYEMLDETFDDSRLLHGWSMDSVHLEFMDDSKHEGLRQLLAQDGAFELASVYRAFVLFLEEHTHND